MKSLFSNQLSDFADIYADDVEIIGVDRPNFDLIETLASEFIESKEFYENYDEIIDAMADLSRE